MSTTVSPRSVERMSLEDYEKKLLAKRLRLDGSELPDPRPMEPPVGYKKQPSMFDRMRDMIKVEFSRRQLAEEEGLLYDGEDDEDYFVEDDPFPVSPKEYSEADQRFIEETVANYNKKIAADKAAKEKAGADAAKAPQIPDEGK